MATIPGSGALSFDTLRTTFGRSGQSISLSQLYRGGDYCPDLSPNTGIPTSGAIDMNDFYSATTTFPGGNISYSDMRALGKTLGACDSAGVTSGGTITVNSQGIGSYDYVIINGDHTVSSFNAGSYFTGTQDTRGAVIVVKGNLTINSGQTFIPSVRKLWTFIYVKGNLTVNGTISMRNRGANHQGTAQANILLASGTFSSVSNPTIPANGGNGGGRTQAGSAGTSGGTGGGGGGQGNGGTTGNGSAGTSYTGGTAGGGCDNNYASPGQSRGGQGGYGGGERAGGGAGNPGGPGRGQHNGSQSGTGGVIIAMCTGTLSGSGSIDGSGQAHGGCHGGSRCGGSTGGGSVNVFYGTHNSGATVLANGTSSPNTGGSGGAGTARKLSF